MKYHILNGDALLKKIDTLVQGQFIVMRECLMEGDVYAEIIEDFWIRRAVFMEQAYQIPKADYLEKSFEEMEKIKHIPENASLYLWFERDLFCQVNLWFTVSYLKKILAQKNLYPFLVLPNHTEWTGFGTMSSEDLLNAYHQKTMLKKNDITLFADAWQTYQQNDLKALTQLSTLAKKRYPHLADVVQAHADRFPENGQPSRPSKVIREIINDLKTTDFEQVFKEFSKREGVYGFGDLQFRRIYDQEMNHNS